MFELKFTSKNNLTFGRVCRYGVLIHVKKVCGAVGDDET